MSGYSNGSGGGGSSIPTPVSIANGGTNSGSALNNGRVMISSGGAVVEASAITASRALISNGSGIPTHSVTTSTELAFVNGVTSAIQTQMDLKAPKASPTFSGTITTPLTASRAVATGASSELVSATTTLTELNLLAGKTVIGDVTGAASSVDGDAATMNGTGGKTIRAEAKFNIAPATGIVVHGPTGSPTIAFNTKLSTLTAWTTGVQVGDTSSSSTFTTSGASGFAARINIPNVTGGSYSYYRASSAGSSGTLTNGAVNVFNYDGGSVSITGIQRGLISNGIRGLTGARLDIENNSATGQSQGVAIAAISANVNVGGYFEAGNGQGSSPKNFGVMGLAAADNVGALVAGVYGKLNTAGLTSGFESSEPAVSAAGYFDNGDTSSPPLIAADNGTICFQVADGGSVTHGAASTTPVHRFNSATQSTVGAAGGASAPPATPTGYLEMNINGTAYVIPYYAKS